jgi:site-specific DNA-cytosine methylase
MNLTYGEVFAGIGAANAAFQPLGWRNKYFIEKLPTALLQYLFNWDDEFYGGVLTSYHTNLPLKLSDTTTYRRLLDMAKNWKSREKKGDLYIVNDMLANPTQYFSFPYEIKQFLDDFKVDIAMTSPPCQSFSVAGKRAGLEDDKGDLFFETHRFLELTLPRVFILENVPGMLDVRETVQYDNVALNYAKKNLFQNALYRHQPTKKPRDTFYDIILPSLSISANTTVYPKNTKIVVWRSAQNKVEVLKPLPYNVKFLIIGAPSFGSPMQRKRVFLVGFRNDIDSSSFKFNIPIIPNRGVSAYIDPDAKITRSFRYKLYKPGTYAWDASATSKKTIDSKGLHYNPEAEPYIPTLLTKQDPRKIGIKMSTGEYRSFADDQMRNLMGFPSGFSSSIVSYSAALAGYGNSIYVPALNHIGKQIEKVLKKNTQ